MPADQAPCEANCALKNTVCPYYTTLFGARVARSVVTNYDYGLTTLRYHPKPFMSAKDWIIADEAQHLDAQLTAAAEATLNKRQFDELTQRPWSEDPIEWAAWATHNLELQKPRKGLAVTAYEEVISAMNDDEKSVPPAEVTKTKRRMRMLTELVGNLEIIEENGEDESWVLTFDKRTDTLKVRPLWPDQVKITEDFFASAERILLMSATLPPLNELEQLYGLEKGSVDVIEVPSIVPLENRMVYVVPVAKMNYKLQMTEVVKSMKIINSMLHQNPAEKVLIHTSSYALQQRAYELLEPAHLSRTILHDSDNREQQLNLFKESDQPLVLLSPSAESGLDVPELKLQFILKVLYPSLGDKWIKQRSQDRKEWYQQVAIDNTVQAIGRTPRSPDIKGRTFIFDSSFRFLWYNNKHRFPKYVQEAIQFIKPA